MRAVADEAVQRDVDTFVSGAAGMKEPSRADVVKAMRLYFAIKTMCAKYSLDGLTLNCFDLIPAYPYDGMSGFGITQWRRYSGRLRGRHPDDTHDACRESCDRQNVFHGEPIENYR